MPEKELNHLMNQKVGWGTYNTTTIRSNKSKTCSGGSPAPSYRCSPSPPSFGRACAWKVRNDGSIRTDEIMDAGDAPFT